MKIKIMAVVSIISLMVVGFSGCFGKKGKKQQATENKTETKTESSTASSTENSKPEEKETMGSSTDTSIPEGGFTKQTKQKEANKEANNEENDEIKKPKSSDKKRSKTVPKKGATQQSNKIVMPGDGITPKKSKNSDEKLTPAQKKELNDLMQGMKMLKQQGAPSQKEANQQAVSQQPQQTQQTVPQQPKQEQPKQEQPQQASQAVSQQVQQPKQDQPKTYEVDKKSSSTSTSGGVTEVKPVEKTDKGNKNKGLSAPKVEEAKVESKKAVPSH